MTPKEAIDRVANADLWLIRRVFGEVTFFFFTNEQVTRYQKSGKQESYAKEYCAVLKRYDEFNYVNEDEFRVRFDSKQNFDTKYGSNWFYYDR
jgi:hypothetical protein